MTARRAFPGCILAACTLAGGAPMGVASAAASATAPLTAAPAGMAARGHRATTAGIDVVTYPTHVRNVVVVLGALPAGDAMAGAGNAAVPSLTGMMLDRGTTTLDKFAIAERLEDVGASISFGVGTQSLEIRAKCLRKDLPHGALDPGRRAENTGASRGGARQGQAATHRLAARILAEHGRARPGGVRARGLPSRPSEPPAFRRGHAERHAVGDAR